MVREWTDDQRVEARERAIKQGLGRKGEITEAPSAEAMLLAKAQGTPPQQTTEELSAVIDKETMGGDRGTIDHTKPGLVRVYKPTAYGFKPRRIPVTNLAQALKGGFLPHCPDCNPRGIDGEDCGDGINDCPAREKRAYRVCPIPQCGKQIYDYQQDIAGEQDEDAMRIDDDAYMQATPALRTKSVLDKHMLSLHPNEAAAAGIVAPSLRAVERRVPDVSAV